MKKITILAPAYREADNLPRLHAALSDITSAMQAEGREYDWEFLIVNDGSPDATLEVAEDLRRADPRVSVLSLTRNFGKENAMLAGMDYASGEAVIFIDADLQDPVSLIPEMVAAWEEGYDDVYGERRTRGRESWVRKRLTLAYYDILQRSTRINVLRNVGDFRLLSRRAVDALRHLRETRRYTKGLFSWIGYRKKAILFDRDDRAGGESSFSLGGLFNLAIEGITGFTTAPLRFASIVGILVSLVAFVYLLVVLTKTIFFGEVVRGYPTLLCVILFLGGCQLLCLGIIGEYVGRIFSETKQRPPYIADTFNGEKIIHQKLNL